MTTTTTEKKVRGAGCFLYPGPKGLLVPDAGKAFDDGGGGGMYTAGAQLERAHLLECADKAFAETQTKGLKLGKTFGAFLDEMAGALSTVTKTANGRMIGKEAKAHVMWALSSMLLKEKPLEPSVTPMAMAAACGFLEWAATNKFKPMIVSRRLFDERVGYCVEVDAIGTLGGVMTALTVVIGPKLYDKHIQENASAVHAANANGNGVKQGVIVRLPRDAEDFAECPFEVRLQDGDELNKQFEIFNLKMEVFKLTKGWKREYAKVAASEKPKKRGAA